MDTTTSQLLSTPRLVLLLFFLASFGFSPTRGKMHLLVYLSISIMTPHQQLTTRISSWYTMHSPRDNLLGTESRKLGYSRLLMWVEYTKTRSCEPLCCKYSPLPANRIGMNMSGSRTISCQPAETTDIAI